jgi:hypothetical protein
VSIAATVYTQAYRRTMGPLVHGLPAVIAKQAGDHVEAAVQIPALAHAARVASVGAMNDALWVLAGAAVIGAVISALFVPRRGAENAAPKHAGTARATKA